MKSAIIAKKLGMTQIFDDDGKVIPVTVVEAGPCFVSQIKTVEKDGYSAVQMAYGKLKPTATTKAIAGTFKKAGVEAKKYIKEFKLDNAENYALGQEIKCDSFQVGDKVDVSGVSKGHGFTGVIKRWNNHRLKMTHGTGPVHREVGSMGANSYPSRVFKNKKMAGQWGNENVSVQNLTIVRVDAERNLLLIKGSVPGPKNSIVFVKSTVKA